MRVSEAVPGADADQRDARAPDGQRLRHVPVRAAVVRDLQHVDPCGPRLKHTVLGACLGVPEQEGPSASGLDEQDNTGVVRIQHAFTALWPQHAHRGASDAPHHVPSQPDDPIGP